MSRVSLGYKGSNSKKNQVHQMRCQSITLKGTQCRRNSINDGRHCLCHYINQPPAIPDTSGWPSDVKIPLHWIRNQTLAFFYLSKTAKEGEKIEDDDDVSLLKRRFLFLQCTSILLQRPDLLKIKNMSDLVDMCIIKMDPYPCIAEYREHFARSLSAKHRHEAKRRYIELIFKQSDLKVRLQYHHN